MTGSALSSTHDLIELGLGFAAVFFGIILIDNFIGRRAPRLKNVFLYTVMALLASILVAVFFMRHGS